MNTVFECQKCGHCCQGKGGIVLSSRDLRRLASYLELSEEETASRYAEIRAGKLKLRQGGDGYCLFFKEGEGCGIHPAKPDVCKAWPFFRGNLTDPVSLEMAAEYCPGINKAAPLAQFAQEGLDYLVAENLVAAAEPGAPNALKVSDLLLPGQRS